jgi:mono/diheme cytochrome c family protein
MFIRAFIFLFVIGAAIISEASDGRTLYFKYCSSCHHHDRIGFYAPPLLPSSLEKLSFRDIERIIKEGIQTAPLKPAFSSLTDEEIKAIVDFLRSSPSDVRWGEEEIKKSAVIFNVSQRPLRLKDKNNLTVAVERGNNKVWVMEGEDILDKFDYGNIHGGIKFSSDARRFFVPSRDGWIGRYDIDKGALYGKVRACVHMRNISLSRDGNYLIASCLLPKAIVFINSDTLMPAAKKSVEGKINAIYELQTRDDAIFTFRDLPLIGVVDTRGFNVRYIEIEDPLDGFFIEPFENYIVGSSRNGKMLKVYALKDGRKVFEHPIESMPHLFSASFWYSKGSFYFATPHTKSPYLSIWRMYDWGFLKRIDLGGEGFLVRTNSNAPYLWVDNGTDEVVLIDKGDLSIKRITPVKGKKVTHTELSADGRIAYISIYGSEGYLMLYDAGTLKELKRFPANLPAGKYNYVNKSRRFDTVQLGNEVFKTKCWGCHHPTRDAFGPSFQWIIKNRDEGIIRAYMRDPLRIYKELGYSRSVMPRIELREEEVEAIMSFIKESAGVKDN